MTAHEVKSQVSIFFQKLSCLQIYQQDVTDELISLSESFTIDGSISIWISAITFTKIFSTQNSHQWDKKLYDSDQDSNFAVSRILRNTNLSEFISLLPKVLTYLSLSDLTSMKINKKLSEIRSEYNHSRILAVKFDQIFNEIFLEPSNSDIYKILWTQFLLKSANVKVCFIQKYYVLISIFASALWQLIRTHKDFIKPGLFAVNIENMSENVLNLMVFKKLNDTLQGYEQFILLHEKSKYDIFGSYLVEHYEKFLQSDMVISDFRSLLFTENHSKAIKSPCKVLSISVDPSLDKKAVKLLEIVDNLEKTDISSRNFRSDLDYQITVSLEAISKVTDFDSVSVAELTYNIYSKMILREMIPNTETDAIKKIFNSESFSKSVVALAFQAINNSKSCKFPWVLDILDLKASEFYRIIEPTIRCLAYDKNEDLTRFLKKFQNIEDECVLKYCWDKSSTLYREMVALSVLPSVADSIPNQPLSPSRPVSPKLLDSPAMASSRFSAITNENTKRQLFQNTGRKLYSAKSLPTFRKRNDKRVSKCLKLFMRKMYQLGLKKIQHFVNLMKSEFKWSSYFANKIASESWKLFQFTVQNHFLVNLNKSLIFTLMSCIYASLKINNDTFVTFALMIRALSSTDDSTLKEILSIPNDYHKSLSFLSQELGKSLASEVKYPNISSFSIIQFYNFVFVPSVLKNYKSLENTSLSSVKNAQAALILSPRSIRIFKDKNTTSKVSSFVTPPAGSSLPFRKSQTSIKKPRNDQLSQSIIFSPLKFENRQNLKSLNDFMASSSFSKRKKLDFS